MKKVLICGHRSFVASGLTDRLLDKNISFDCFSRGEKKREGNIVTGNVLQMEDNDSLDSYETVINFIILKEKSVEENLEYIKSLLAFCEKRQVKNLIQISSISAYPNDVDYVNEDSPIEIDYKTKGGYASIKVAVDHYIDEHKPQGLTVSYVRPGFIYDKGKEPSKAGILVSKFGINVLLGDKHTSLPLISKSNIHEALCRIIERREKNGVYLLLDKDKDLGTKYNFVADQWNVRPICLYRWMFMPLAKLLMSVGVFKKYHYMKVAGLFKHTWYDSSKTEQSLQMNLGRKEIAVIGAGTYGSYTANLLSNVYPHEKIILYDVGNENLKTEEEIGYLSHITKAPYEGLQKARFFGFGGASVKWGGQLLTFGDNDFSNPDQLLKEIVEIDKKYKNIVLAKFGLKNDEPEVRLSRRLFTKTGIWLSYFHRNLFKHFGIIHNHKIHIVPNTRIVKINAYNGDIRGLECLQGGKPIEVSHDYYFLTTGAFESARLLINSGLTKELGRQNFSDHLSQRAFKVKSGAKMGGEDFTFKVQGASLVTKRIIGEIDGYSFYSQPICNEDFPFFQNLKKFLFGHHFSLKLIADIVKDIPQCIAFAWCMLVLKRMYIYKNEFYLQIDIEAPRESGENTLSSDKDKYGEHGINVALNILPKTGEIFTEARKEVKAFLDANNVVYEELPFSTTAEKYEDVYHPFGMFCDFRSIDEYYKHFKNMLVVNTGVLPRAGGINSTCAVLPLVEEFVNNRMKL